MDCGIGFFPGTVCIRPIDVGNRPDCIPFEFRGRSLVIQPDKVIIVAGLAGGVEKFSGGEGPRGLPWHREIQTPDIIVGGVVG